MKLNGSLDNTSYLKNIYDNVREKILNVDGLKGLCCIIIFGSAARPEDFVIGVSDVDILVITREKPKRRRYEFVISKSIINITVFTVDELKMLIEHGDPLTFMLKHIVILYNNCCDTILNSKPRITEHTELVLRRSIFVALSLSLENYYIERNYIKALSHLYHSIRHLARYKALSKGIFPVSDEEVYRNSSPQLKKLFITLSNARREGEDRERELKFFIDKAMKLIAGELKLKPPSLKLVDKFGKRANLIIVGELDNYMALRVEIYEGHERRVVEIKCDDVREIDSIFFS